MKKILTIAAVCAGLMSFTACNDFLDEDPKSTLTNVGYYQTEAQALANVNYLYRIGAIDRMSSAPSAYIGCFASVNQMLTGYFSNSYEGQEQVCKYARELTRQQFTMRIASTMDEAWDDSYKAINTANSLIKHIGTIPMAEETKAQLIAEAKFFRAFNYFFLVKTFGGVPLYTEPYESPENMELKRSSVADVYSQIEADLKDALSLPAVRYQDNGHRISKFVVAMTLSSVYMQENKYAEAAEMAKIVIDSPHKLTANGDMDMHSAFNQLRTQDDIDEVIYSREYDATISPSNWFPTYAFNGTATAVFSTYSIFERVFGPTNQFLNVYEKNDLRIQPNQFFHWEYKNPNTGATWKSEDAAGCWYYYDEEALLNTGRGTKDFNIYRYAEALLNGAEAIAQSKGVTPEAAGYLAQVQARSNMEGKTVADLTAKLQTLSKEAFIEACWVERLREFPLEFKMWDDCTRTKKFPVISKTEKGKVQFVDLIGATNGSGATFKETDLYWPISVNEIQRNPNLEQNAGYSRE